MPLTHRHARRLDTSVSRRWGGVDRRIGGRRVTATRRVSAVHVRFGAIFLTIITGRPSGSGRSRRRFERGLRRLEARLPAELPRGLVQEQLDPGVVDRTSRVAAVEGPPVGVACVEIKIYGAFESLRRPPRHRQEMTS